MTNITKQKLIATLTSLGDPIIAEHSQRFFKTGKGQYGEGDQFIGVRVPVLRQQVKQFLQLDTDDVIELLYNPIHEIRLTAVLILVAQFERAKEQSQKHLLFGLYIQHSKQINNWDLVDSSAHKIVGPMCYPNDTKLLFDLAKSNNLWQRRIAIIATLYFIKQGHFQVTLALSELLISDEHDLMHKAVGWMLREMGKQDQQPLLLFLEQFSHVMPRTMLRYAIEKLPKSTRQDYMQRKGKQ
jgi:3-methyladenine DNA glycosylase AlkD